MYVPKLFVIIEGHDDHKDQPDGPERKYLWFALARRKEQKQNKRPQNGRNPTGKVPEERVYSVEFGIIKHSVEMQVAKSRNGPESVKDTIHNSGSCQACHSKERTGIEQKG